MSLSLRSLRGAAVRAHLPALAALRARVFREWPYLYQADDPDYEARYLAAYSRSPDSLFVLALDGETVIGAATAIPLRDDDASFAVPFIAAGIDPSSVFYFGESVLLPEYRGRGIGHRFFDAREAYALGMGRFAMTAFCAVERHADDPRRPADHRGNEAFWTARGYRRQDSMRCALDWKEVGGEATVPHTLQYWLRPLDSGDRA